MKIEINGIEREAIIVQAPKGSFIVTDGGSFPIYINFVAFCQPLGDEKDFGNILECPITDFNGGYASCEVDELFTEFMPIHLKKCIQGWMDDYEGNLCDAVDEIIDDLNQHEILIAPRCIDIINEIRNGKIKNIDEI